MTTISASPRRPGRPRDVRVDDAIIDAALHLLAETGPADLSVEAVAARAGVGKATIYRRWPSKDALIVEALARLTDARPPVLKGESLRDDLVTILESVRRRHSSTLAGRIMHRVIGEAPYQTQLMRLYQERVVAPRRARLLRLLEDAVRRGELTDDVDVEVAADLLIGPLMFRLLTRTGDEALARDWPARLVDAALRGLAPR